jgi:probable F420-dependent oxidoreductase
VPKIQFGFQFPNVTGYSSFDHLRKVAEAVEDLGFDSIWTSDHVLPVDAFQKSGEPGMYESVTTLAYLAAVTKKIAIGSSVLLPLRHPLLLATMFNTIDHASSGRLRIGFGVGWYSLEFENMGIPFTKRGKVANEQLKIMRMLWTKPTVNYEGEFYTLKDAKLVPKPVQKPYPPILIGGYSAQAFIRSVELGDGWMPYAASVEDVRKGMDEIKRVASSKKRNLKDFLLYVDLPTTLKPKDISGNASGNLLKINNEKESTLTGDANTIANRIERYMSVGVQQIILEFEEHGKEIENLKLFKSEVASRF